MAAPRMEPVEKDVMAQVARQRVVSDYFERWLRQELQGLPYAGENAAVAQGRCQVLLDIKSLFEQSLPHTD